MGLAKSVVLDFVISFLFLFIGSTAGATVMLLAPYFGDDETTSLILLLSVLAVQLVMFGAMIEGMGGASFNPLGNLANYYLGEGNESLLSLALKLPAQLSGCILGAWAIQNVLPSEYQHTLSGPKLGPGVDMWTGMIAEAVITFAVNFVILWALLAGPKSFVAKSSILAAAVITGIVLGAPYTGPSMNPAFAFSWAYMSNTHRTDEHLWVYWIAPTVGILSAAVVFGATLHPKSRQQKGAAASKAQADSSSSKEKTS
eukprot:TRINITY_DN32743_c0_g1_i1.p1 TRINITY_DN32743_c0_g1~~TRINITY_DN32743_c0_g1_i1.p1  ORF type:complete len:257 (+),score=45.65 TRINITY_DN32743_c0_g1_i1:325-1095(+)